MFLDERLEQLFEEKKKNNRELAAGIYPVLGGWLTEKFQQKCGLTLDDCKNIVRQGKSACSLFYKKHRHELSFLREDFYDVIIRDFVADTDFKTEGLKEAFMEGLN